MKCLQNKSSSVRPLAVKAGQSGSNQFRAALTSLLLGFCWLSFHPDAFGLGQTPYVESVKSQGSLTLVQDNSASILYVDSRDYPGVIRAVSDLQKDIASVSGVTPVESHQE